MRALYVIWPDLDMIDKFIDSGIDTLIIANTDYPEDVNLSKHWGAWDDCEKVLERYKNSGIKLIFAPVWIPYWRDLPKYQRCMINDTEWKRTPNPCSISFVTSRLLPALNICKEYGASLGFDFENYGRSEEGWKNMYHLDAKKRIACDKCKKTVRDQYKEQEDIIDWCMKDGKYDKNEFFYFPYDHTWVPDMFGQDKKVFLTERTYKGMSTKACINARWQKLRYGIDTVAGIWAEKFSEEDYLYEIERVLDNSAFDGFWAYIHAKASKNSWIHTKPEYAKKVIASAGEPYYTDLYSDSFFSALKNLNA